MQFLSCIVVMIWMYRAQIEEKLHTMLIDKLRAEFIELSVVMVS